MIPDEALAPGQDAYKTDDALWEIGLISDAGWAPDALDTYASLSALEPDVIDLPGYVRSIPGVSLAYQSEVGGKRTVAWLTEVIFLCAGGDPPAPLTVHGWFIYNPVSGFLIAADFLRSTGGTPTPYTFNLEGDELRIPLTNIFGNP